MFQQLLLLSVNNIEIGVYELIIILIVKLKSISSYLKGRITKDHLID